METRKDRVYGEKISGRAVKAVQISERGRRRKTMCDVAEKIAQAADDSIDMVRRWLAGAEIKK